MRKSKFMTAKFTRRITLILVCALFAYPFGSPAEEDTKKNPEIDLKRTAGYLQEWAEMRPGFPESLSFAYYYAFASMSLEKKIAPEAQKKIINYIRACQTPDGGFVAEPGFTSEPDLVSTYFALKTLEVLNSFEAVDKKKAAQFVLSLSQEDGGMRAGPKSKYSSVMTSFYGIASLDLLGALQGLNKEKAVSYLMSFRDKDKGFGVEKGKPSRPPSTFAAVHTLKILGALNDEVKAGAVKYLKETRYAGLHLEETYTTQPTIQDMAYVLEAFADLSAGGEVNRDSIYEFIASLYIPENGGFGPQPGYGASPPSTYYGVLCLKQLGKLN
ncbi:MAG: hypothetical protein COT35_10705 [Nitrospirae bacterium CG08_land_8_20_14_0_20_52_24]|nr:MAG: hypothetical protein COT35_10705 [Nitrospirae bacterium CG08_land_8_20_14_0_20_52_24]PIV83295.1 MAG: hypothetical protein COW52_09080 [Nitrospirae bacterium CG17_big_fil_post_rev_8_21_14_2_50_50_9]PIW84672.1 MAG: hypothetical protein COZ95_08640 [Nitrospirae bacterium CG_4_8_14_3_um_filter_50_41]PIX85232.1 MAG: hypothetical protein COZ32_09525 [Nitrospirae bacterium CG_4_10_14_3_um_filter_53_41]